MADIDVEKFLKELHDLEDKYGVYIDSSWEIELWPKKKGDTLVYDGKRYDYWMDMPPWRNGSATDL